METKKISKNIVLSIVIFLLIILVLAILFYSNLSKKSTITVKGTIQYVGDNYIIVVAPDTEEEYYVKTEEKYQVGDQVSFVMKDIKKGTNPQEGTVEKLETISKSVQFSIMDSPQSEDILEQSPSHDNKGNLPTKEENTNDSTSNINESSDSVVSYFENLNQEVENYPQDKSLGQSIKSGFVTIVDFLFYKGTICGKTFDELSDTAKLKVLKLAFSIDSKIEEYFPNYKKEISQTGSKIYTNVKTKALELYLDITTKVCQEDPDTCTSAKAGLADLKKNFSLTWNLIKDISSAGLSKLKAWYEVWKDAT